jgi:hypothetical protein
MFVDDPRAAEANMKGRTVEITGVIRHVGESCFILENARSTEGMNR